MVAQDPVEIQAMFAKQLDELCRRAEGGIKKGQAVPKKLADRCQFGRELGQGSFGLVSEVLFEDDGKYYALKAIHIEDQEELDLASDEVFHHSVMEHRNLCKMIDSYVSLHDQRADILMELWQGGSLHDEMLRLQRAGEKMPVDTIWSYLIQIVDGLHFMHDPAARNNPDVPGTLVHGDLKPNNIFFKDIKKRHVKIGDFGLVRHLEGTTWDEYTGTPAYMGPELIVGKPSGEKVDIFALGCMLFQMLNEGVHPFAGFDASDLPQVYGQEDPFEVIESTGFDGDAVLVGFMRQMLNVNPDKRPSTSDLIQSSAFQTKRLEMNALELTAEKKDLQSEIEHLKNVLKSQAVKHNDAMAARAQETQQAWMEAARQRDSKLFHRERHGYYKQALQEEKARASFVEERLQYPPQYLGREELFCGGPVRPARRGNRLSSPYAAARNVARQPQADTRPTYYHSIDISVQARHHHDFRF